MVYVVNSKIVIPEVFNNKGILIHKDLIVFNQTPSFWFSNDSASKLNVYLTLFIDNNGLFIDCMYIDSFNNINGFYEKKSKCGLHQPFLSNQDSLENFIYSEWGNQINLSFAEIIRNQQSFSVVVGKVDDLIIERFYTSVNEYISDEYSIMITDIHGNSIYFDNKIYLRYDDKNTIVGIELEEINEGQVYLSFYSSNDLNNLLKKNVIIKQKN